MPPASSNWLALQKKLPSKKSSQPPLKRRKLDTQSESDFVRSRPDDSDSETANNDHEDDDEPANGDPDSPPSLRKMVRGQVTYTDAQKLPGKYIAIDCEMVGIGIDGTESSLARVSIVNYHGHILLDEIVRQREKVVDYRTRWSGIREKDMLRSKPFDEIQKQAAELLQDRILIGHAVFNDLKALLLSHPRPLTRDTQVYAHKHKVTKSKYIALRNLVKQELDLAIQEGEHSSVTDARATMAVFRIHKKEWEKGTEAMVARSERKKKRKRDDGEDEPESFPGGGRKGISSGLSTVVTENRKSGKAGKKADGAGEWWKSL